MSFILDALKKSENERQRQSGPALFEVRVAAPAARFPVWAVALGALLGINVIGFVAWAMLRESGGAAAVPSAAPPTIAIASPDTAATAPAAAAMPAVAAATGGAPGATAPAATASVAGAAFNPPLIEDPGLSADDLPATPAPAGGGSQPPAARTRETRSGLPSRDELAAAGGTDIPAVTLSLHVYDGSATRRFVIINGQRAREGEQLPNGLRVDEITPQGAVLSWRDSRFLVTVQ